MVLDPLDTLPPKGRFALVDLIERSSQPDNHNFLNRLRKITESVKGRVVVSNEALLPMILPDEGRPQSEDHISRLMVSEYPTNQSLKAALVERRESEAPAGPSQIRSYVVRPAPRVESLIGRGLPFALGLLNRQSLPSVPSEEALETVIEAALVLGEQPDKTRWKQLFRRTQQQPVWMLNFLEFADQANYPTASHDHSASASPLTGSQAYQRYGRGMVSSLGAVGGRVGWSGKVIAQVSGAQEGSWHQVAIAVYPSAVAMMTMLALPKYRAAHIHRAAGLLRTRLLATRPTAVSPNR
ncbi:MAG: hypothetical protein P8M78_09520 [Myxococcota bacterium]|nr:hypothetical protein [Myxococcota bacterium]